MTPQAQIEVVKLPVEEISLEGVEVIRIPELEKRENAKWLELLIDTEGSMGWRSRVIRRDRINVGYRCEYTSKARSTLFCPAYGNCPDN